MEKMWEKVGIIGVDSGLCWIGDPCYCVTPDCKEHPAKTWPDFVRQLAKSGITNWPYKNGREGMGMSVQTGHGDGTYPVFVQKNSKGVVEAVKVVFIEDE